MKLYNFDPSPNPLKVRLALAELDKNYEKEEVILFKGEQRHDDFLKVNPLGKVPVLIDGDLVLRESNAILAYLGREYGKDMWPKNPREEALALQWLFFESVHMAGCFGPVWFNHFGLPKIGGESKPLTEMTSQVERVKWALESVKEQLMEGPYILGEQFSLVDCSIGTQMAAIKETGILDLDEWSSIREYLDRIISRPSWSKACGAAIWDI